MIRAEQALQKILSMGISEEPDDALMHRAKVLIQKFKADSLAYHQAMAVVGDRAVHIAQDLEKLRDVVDREIDRRLDLDLADHSCDLLEHLSGYLHEETDRPAQSDSAPDRTKSGGDAVWDAESRHRMVAVEAYRLAEQRQFEPGHELEDWLAAERALDVQRKRENRESA